MIYVNCKYSTNEYMNTAKIYFTGEVDHYDLEETDFLAQARSRLESLSSCFAQLTHKAQTVFQANAKLEVCVQFFCCFLLFLNSFTLLVSMSLITN